MISILPLSKVIASFAVAYAVFMSFIMFVLHGYSLSVFESIIFMVSGFGILNLVVGLCLNFGWKYIWKIFPILNQWVFPDLSGHWEMGIEWKGKDEQCNDKSGSKQAKAIIKQSLLKISMEVESEDSDSETIVAKPKKAPESDRPELFYAFLVTPHEKKSVPLIPYKGTALLTLRNDDTNELSGNYFTDRQSSGRFKLKRCVT